MEQRLLYPDSLTLDVSANIVLDAGGGVVLGMMTQLAFKTQVVI